MSEQIIAKDDGRAGRRERLAKEIHARQKTRKAVGIALGVASIASALIAFALK